jgi:cytochrome bd-type quinol oxidase subunit 2
MQTTFWLVLLSLFIAGYLVLEGADFGAAILLPVVGRDDRAGRDRIVRAIAPVFLGNEVWLVATIGVVVGAFPRLDGVLLSRYYPVFMVLLAAWLLRDAGLWFRRHGNEIWRWRWDRAIAVASALLAVGWGIVIADIALGVPANAIGPIPVLCGLLLAGFCVLHAKAVYSLAVPTADRALSLAVAGAVLVVTATLLITGSPGEHWPLWVLGALVATATVVRAWPVTSVALAADMPLAALTSFPYLPTHLTVTAASDPATLAALTPIVAAVLPILVVAQVGLWWLNRRTARAGGYF